MESLQVFGFNLKLKQALAIFIAHNVLQDLEFEKMLAFFKSDDAENTGKVTREKIVLAFRNQTGIEYSEDKIDYLIKRTDTLGTGHIDYK
jgi:Ca2+-binding EF-hand superfamily protein